MAFKKEGEKIEKKTEDSNEQYRYIKVNIHIGGLLLSILLWVLVIACLVAAVRLGIFPALFIVFFGVILILLSAIILLTQFTERMCKKGMIAAGILCPILLFIAVQLHNTDQVIQKVASTDYQKVEMGIITLKDDGAESIEDTKDYTFGIQKDIDAELMKKTTGRLKKIFGKSVKVKKYSGFEDQIGALYNEKVDAIILNTGIDSLIQTLYKSFSENTKVVGKVTLNYKIKEKKDADLENSPFNILVIGVDEDKDIQTSTLSTMNYLICAHPDSRQLLNINIPNNYYISLGEMTEDKLDLLEVASAVKVDYAIQAVEELYDTNINYFAKFDMNALANIIDDIGEIAVKSDSSFHTSDGRYYFKKGINHMDGEKAMAYWNELEDVENPEVQRSRNQEYVLEGIIAKLKSPLTFLHYSSVLDTIEENFRTNLSAEQIKYLLREQISADKDSKWESASLIANGVSTRKYTYYSSERSLPAIVPAEKTNSIIYALIREVQRGDTLTTEELTIPIASKEGE